MSTQAPSETLQETPKPSPSDLAVVLSGGGARAAYQVGLLRGLGKILPEARIPIVTGVSAGGINAAFLAAHPGPISEASEELAEIWSELEVEDVFRVDTASLSANFARWVGQLTSGGSSMAPKVRGLVDTSPLDSLLSKMLKTVDGEIIGIERNLDRGHLQAIALTTISYNTGQTITWVEGSDIRTWERPMRQSHQIRLTVDHVMASAALPLLFPAIRLGTQWHGDGGIRLSAPLSPAIHLGARRILVVSTRYRASAQQAGLSTITDYPPPAQILGKLLNSVFLDLIDQDVSRLRRVNELIARIPEENREPFHLIDALVMRPSEDLGRLAGEYEPRLPRAFRFLTRSLGTRQTSSPDFLSMLMFQPDYLRRLIAIGERDAESKKEELIALMSPKPSP